MDELFHMSILAKSDGVVEVVFFVVVATFGIIGSIVTNLKKKREEQQQQQRLAESRTGAEAENDTSNDDGWTVVKQPPVPVSPPPETSQKVVSIGDFIKSAPRRLVQEQKVHKPEPIPVPVPISVQLKSAATEKPKAHSSHQPKIVHHHSHKSTSQPKRRTIRNSHTVHRTVTDTAVVTPVYPAGKDTVQLDAAAARKAIIFHEIFSPPKALREQYELWD